MGKIFCPSCGDSIDENESLTSYTSSFNNQNYKLYHCLKCDLRSWEPLKVLPSFYEEEEDEGYVILHQGLRERISQWHIPFF